MFNKRIITIIILAAIIFFSSAALVFLLFKRTGDKPAVDKIGSYIGELKKYHPEFSRAQLEYYAAAAARGTVSACSGRADESACLSSVALIKGDRNFCHDLEYKSEISYQGCLNDILKKMAGAETGQCALLSSDNYYNCLWAIFGSYSEPKDCAGLPDSGARLICQDFFNYRAAYAKYDRELCKTVKTEKLNQYCLKVIIDKNQDTDGDGLTDLDEINKYKTHYLFFDTDNDGVNDGEAVKRGLIKAK